jgi:hypothetical protein
MLTKQNSSMFCIVSFVKKTCLLIFLTCLISTHLKTLFFFLFLFFFFFPLIKIFCQNTLWKMHLLISKQQEDNEKTCSIKGWDVIPKQNAKCQNSITILTTWLDHINKVFHLQSYLPIHLLSLFWNPWQNLQSFPSL